MPISTYYRNAMSINSYREKNDYLMKVNQQVQTGIRETSYGKYGIQDTQNIINAKEQVNNIDIFDSSIETAKTRMDFININLEEIDKYVSETKKTLRGLSLNQGEEKLNVDYIKSYAKDMLNIVNTTINSQTADGRYIFSAGKFSESPVEDMDVLINGDATRAGFKKVLDERNTADISHGMGRLELAKPTATSLELSEKFANSVPFGFKINNVTSALQNATVSSPTGDPASFNVNFTGLPQSNNEITIKLDLPDGTSTSFTLKAVSENTGYKNTFLIGTDATTTRDNLHTAIEDKLKELAQTDLKAASSIKAAEEFFGSGDDTQAKRVSGVPLEDAVTLVDATVSDTIKWYKGSENADIRSDVKSKVGYNRYMEYGVSVKEIQIKQGLKNLALLHVSTKDLSDATVTQNEVDFVNRLGKKLSLNINNPKKDGDISQVIAEFGSKIKNLKLTEDANRETKLFYQERLSKVQSVDKQEALMLFQNVYKDLQNHLSLTAKINQINYFDYIR